MQCSKTRACMLARPMVARRALKQGEVPMLVLERKTQQSFTLEDVDGRMQTITILVVSVVGGSVKIGIDAPDNIHVLRDDAINKMAIRKMPKQEIAG